MSNEFVKCDICLEKSKCKKRKKKNLKGCYDGDYEIKNKIQINSKYQVSLLFRTKKQRDEMIRIVRENANGG